ncbi:MAG TPA: hypothetical protein VFU47_08245, partial [Armatimonadota bacterium]|nr:hypothetical protein [Armatimonadota bacterium]
MPAAAPVKRPPRKDGVMRIGLRRLSGGTSVTASLTAPGWLIEPATGRKLHRLPGATPVVLAADFATGG